MMCIHLFHKYVVWIFAQNTFRTFQRRVEDLTFFKIDVKVKTNLSYHLAKHRISREGVNYSHRLLWMIRLWCGFDTAILCFWVIHNNVSRERETGMSWWWLGAVAEAAEALLICFSAARLTDALHSNYDTETSWADRPPPSLLHQYLCQLADRKKRRGKKTQEQMRFLQSRDRDH